MHALKGNFLNALLGNNHERPPVWFMRQAGRYLPSYQEFRKKHLLLDLFLTPELAATITALPVDELGVDAAIFFSDIMIPAIALGFKLEFVEGPKVDPFLSPNVCFPFHIQIEKLRPVFQGIQLAKQKIDVPLIGFCGGPFTFASYLMKNDIIEWVNNYPSQLKELLDVITTLSIIYLKLQIDAGVDAIQIFDSWANILTKEQFRIFCVPYYQKIFNEIHVPAILFTKELGKYLDEVLFLPCAFSLDTSISMSCARKKTTKPLQGNLDPNLLFEPVSVIEKKARELMQSMKGDPAFIAGLGHGVKPGVPLESVKYLVRLLQGKE